MVYLNRKCTEERFPGPASASSPSTSRPSSPAALGVRDPVGGRSGSLGAAGGPSWREERVGGSGGGSGQLTPVGKQRPACAAAWTRPPGPGWTLSRVCKPAPQGAAHLGPCPGQPAWPGVHCGADPHQGLPGFPLGQLRSPAPTSVLLAPPRPPPRPTAPTPVASLAPARLSPLLPAPHRSSLRPRLPVRLRAPGSAEGKEGCAGPRGAGGRAFLS